MLTEKDLLFDIINNTPENSVWNIFIVLILNCLLKFH